MLVSLRLHLSRFYAHTGVQRPYTYAVQHWFCKNALPTVQCCSAKHAHSNFVSQQLHLWRLLLIQVCNDLTPMQCNTCVGTKALMPCDHRLEVWLAPGALETVALVSLGDLFKHGTNGGITLWNSMQLLEAKLGKFREYFCWAWFIGGNIITDCHRMVALTWTGRTLQGKLSVAKQHCSLDRQPS